MSGYLVYNAICGTGAAYGGVQHNLSDLAAQVREAVLLGRTLVVPPPALAVRFNEGYPSSPVWNRYVDLENSLLHIRYKNGEHTICPMPVMSRADFHRLHIPEREYLRLSGETPVSDEHNRRYRVIFKTLATAKPVMNRDIIPLNVYYDHSRIASITTGFKPPELVELLAQPVLQALGTSYAAVHFRRVAPAVFFSQIAVPVLGIRCGFFPCLVMSDLKRLIPRDMPVYFMTDDHRGTYAEGLGQHFTVFTWRRFPELRRLLVQDGTPPDNYLLMQVEQLLFASADVRINTYDDTAHTGFTRYLIMTGKKPDGDFPVRLIRDSKRHVVRLVRFCSLACCGDDAISLLASRHVVRLVRFCVWAGMIRRQWVSWGRRHLRVSRLSSVVKCGRRRQGGGGRQERTRTIRAQDVSCEAGMQMTTRTCNALVGRKNIRQKHRPRLVFRREGDADLNGCTGRFS